MDYRLIKIELKNDGLHVEFIPNAKPLFAIDGKDTVLCKTKILETQK